MIFLDLVGKWGSYFGLVVIFGWLKNVCNLELFYIKWMIELNEMRSFFYVYRVNKVDCIMKMVLNVGILGWMFILY